MTKDELAECMAVLFDYFQEKPNKGRTRVYWMIFGGYDQEQLKRAILGYFQASEGTFFPMPRTIEKYLPGNEKMGAVQAWLFVSKKLSENPWDHPFKGIDCPVMNEAARAVGKEAILDSENKSFAKRDFIEAYEALSTADGQKMIQESRDEALERQKKLYRDCGIDIKGLLK